MQLNVSNIQHFSVGDGPGIRTTVFLKGCPLRCPWCHNPETWSTEPVTLEFPAAHKRQTYGQRLSVEAVVLDVMEDAEFYRDSGGGVTVSGGEPMLQAEGVAALTAALGAHGVNVIVDTAGSVPWRSFEGLHPEAYYYDVKTGSRDQYESVVGADFDLVTGNLARLIAAGERVRVRIPLIPGFNTSPAAYAELRELLLRAGAGEVDLLPFHRLGTAKYEALGREYAYKDVKPLSADVIAEATEFFRRDFATRVE